MAVKVGALTGIEWGPVAWDADMWEDSIEAENFEPSGSRGFILPEVLVFSTLSRWTHTTPSEILPCSPLTKEMNPSLSAKPAKLNFH